MHILWKQAIKYSNKWLSNWLASHGLSNWFDSVFLGHSRAWIDVYGPKFKEIMSYVYYFIPKSYLQPFFTLVITFLIVRVLFALFRVITDLL